MYTPSLLARDSDASASNSGIYNGTCKPGGVEPCQVKSCGLEIAIWTFMLLAFCLLCWTFFSTKRAASPSPAQSSTASNNPLALPHPSASPELSVGSNDRSDQDGKGEDTSGSTLIDPYHVVHSLDNSLISKDASFEGASVPQPALEQKKTGKLVGGGFGINVESGSPIPATPEAKSDKDEKMSTPPPAPAHLHNARWDT